MPRRKSARVAAALEAQGESTSNVDKDIAVEKKITRRRPRANLSEKRRAKKIKTSKDVETTSSSDQENYVSISKKKRYVSISHLSYIFLVLKRRRNSHWILFSQTTIER